MISQAALSITYSPIHTVEYYMGIVDKLVEFGADEIALKDMAGIGRPTMLGKLVYEIKKKYPHIIVQYHGHSGPGFAMASILEVARAGADVIDTAMEPLAWGMVHPGIIGVQAMLKEDGFLVKDINMSAYMEARALTQSFLDDFLGLYVNPANRICTSMLVGCGLPGGMMGSMMSDLKGVHSAINMALKKNGKPEVTFDELTIQLFQEVAYIWPMLGYPPLVTPFSQYTKNIALMNIMALAQGKPRAGNQAGQEQDDFLFSHTLIYLHYFCFENIVVPRKPQRSGKCFNIPNLVIWPEKRDILQENVLNCMNYYA
jgi:pyruvate carboxylase subunit B